MWEFVSLSVSVGFWGWCMSFSLFVSVAVYDPFYLSLFWKIKWIPIWAIRMKRMINRLSRAANNWKNLSHITDETGWCSVYSRRELYMFDKFCIVFNTSKESSRKFFGFVLLGPSIHESHINFTLFLSFINKIRCVSMPIEIFIWVGNSQSKCWNS